MAPFSKDGARSPLSPGIRLSSICGPDERFRPPSHWKRTGLEIAPAKPAGKNPGGSWRKRMGGLIHKSPQPNALASPSMMPSVKRRMIAEVLQRLPAMIPLLGRLCLTPPSRQRGKGVIDGLGPVERRMILPASRCSCESSPRNQGGGPCLNWMKARRRTRAWLADHMLGLMKPLRPFISRLTSTTTSS
ncbi:MAG: hypothetical protein M2R45_05463 [Verrucomicrobia subdivision 3 bacterium]|nr:hypothetical protein [Limisphaerales bacterium]MCS1414370.1 hypothetical protein [Limisphaerales bacterium]